MGVSITYPISTRDKNIDPSALAFMENLISYILTLKFVMWYVMEKPISFFTIHLKLFNKNVSFSQNVKAMPMKYLGKYSCQCYVCRSPYELIFVL